MKNFFGNKVVVGVLFFILIALAAAPSYYFYTKYSQSQKLLESAGAVTGEAVDQILEKAKRHILMPDGEEPTILTVSDKEQLSGQAFYAHAKNGDKVIVFEQAKKAFLYDPIADRILEVGPVLSTGSAQVAGAQADEAKKEAPSRIVLFNGTTVVGLTKTYETKLNEAVENITVVDRDNASSQEYEESILVDLSGSNPRTQAIADTLEIRADSLPAGETKPEDADFLIILGSDAR